MKYKNWRIKILKQVNSKLICSHRLKPGQKQYLFALVEREVHNLRYQLMEFRINKCLTLIITETILNYIQINIISALKIDCFQKFYDRKSSKISYQVSFVSYEKTIEINFPPIIFFKDKHKFFEFISKIVNQHYKLLMFPIFYYTPTFSGYLPQFSSMFGCNLIMTSLSQSPKNQKTNHNLHLNVGPKAQDSENQENSSIKSTNMIKKVAQKLIQKFNKVDNEYRVKDQNAQRNIISNIAHHMMGFIRKECFTRELVEKIINLHNIDTTSEQFFVEFRKIKLRNYVRKMTLQDLWNNKQNINFSKIFRILSFHFLNQKCFCSILYSKKIKNGLKHHHLPKMRQLVLGLRKLKQHK